jgi:hypothetical protein
MEVDMELAEAVKGAVKPWAYYRRERESNIGKWWYTCEPKKDPKEVYKDVYKILMENPEGIECQEILKKTGMPSSAHLSRAMDSLGTEIPIWGDINARGRLEYGVLL